MSKIFILMGKGLGMYFVRKLLIEAIVDAMIEALGKLKDKTETKVDDNAYEKIKADRDEIVKILKGVL